MQVVGILFFILIELLPDEANAFYIIGAFCAEITDGVGC